MLYYSVMYGGQINSGSQGNVQNLGKKTRKLDRFFREKHSSHSSQWAHSVDAMPKKVICNQVRQKL